MLLPLFVLAVRVCSVCKGGEGEIEGLVSIILQARPVHWVSLRRFINHLLTYYLTYSAGAGLIYYPNTGSH